jgi:hypothetical protein
MSGLRRQRCGSQLFWFFGSPDDRNKDKRLLTLVVSVVVVLRCHDSFERFSVALDRYDISSRVSKVPPPCVFQIFTTRFYDAVSQIFHDGTQHRYDLLTWGWRGP